MSEIIAACRRGHHPVAILLEYDLTVEQLRQHLRAAAGLAPDGHFPAPPRPTLSVSGWWRVFKQLGHLGLGPE